MTTTHRGQGWAIELGREVEVPDAADIARSAAAREADAREARIEGARAREKKDKLRECLDSAWPVIVATAKRIGLPLADLPPGVEWRKPFDPKADAFDFTDRRRAR
jgi:hypothetical protein